MNPMTIEFYLPRVQDEVRKSLLDSLSHSADHRRSRLTLSFSQSTLSLSILDSRTLVPDFQAEAGHSRLKKSTLSSRGRSSQQPQEGERTEQQWRIR
ncbi:hypothetical protein L6452_24251 [Arctium lappa]|uniref:Uncharacterized protein n=1 Tax=Arctium lappa TaxID=4217 RepID=A0ACB9A958_ARCLA|nr:hypothetical protein L6452_24251 [Arctium lappa]